MTEHDRVRRERALNRDRDDEQSLIDAIGGLQSTDDPSLVPLYNQLLDELEALQARKKSANRSP